MKRILLFWGLLGCFWTGYGQDTIVSAIFIDGQDIALLEDANGDEAGEYMTCASSFSLQFSPNEFWPIASDTVYQVRVLSESGQNFANINLPESTSEEDLNTSTFDWPAPGLNTLSFLGVSMILIQKDPPGPAEPETLQVFLVDLKSGAVGSASITASPGTILNCDVSSITLTLVDIMDVDPDSVFWQDDTGQVLSGPGVSEITVNTEGTYQAVISCPGTSDLFAIATQMITSEEGSLNPIFALFYEDCEAMMEVGEGQTLPNLSLEWMFGNEVLEGVTSRRHSVTTPGMYTVIVTDTITQCSVTHEFDVDADLLMLPTANLIVANGLSPVLNCDQPRLTVEIEDYDDMIDYSINDITNQTGTITIDSPGTLVLLATSESGCMAEGMLEVMGNKVISDFIDEFSDPICPDEVLNLEVDNATGYAVSWTGATEQMDNSADFSASMGGQYTVVAQLSDDDNNCVGIDTVQVTVTSLQDWSLITKDWPTAIYGNGIVSLENTWEGSWEVIEVSKGLESLLNQGTNTGHIDLNLANVILTDLRAPGFILLQLTAPSCPDDTTLYSIAILPTDDIFIPEVVTPNGDNVNDVWNLGLPDQGIGDLSVQIYDRSGQMLYESQGLYTPWDALNCPDGVYFYRIVYNANIYQGAVTVLGKQ